MQESIPVGAAEARPVEYTSPAAAMGREDPLSDPRALQILSTEHWSLLATRSLAYNEAFSRAGMFLTFLSASLIVIGFLVGSQTMSSAILPVALVLLVADLYIGVVTLGRLIDASSEELQCVRGMNRIRYAYREMVPGLESYFVTGFNDDAQGVLATYAVGQVQTGLVKNVAHGLTTTIGMVGMIDCLLVGALVALIAIGLGAALGLALAMALIAVLLALFVLSFIGMRAAVGQQARAESRFPARPHGT